MKREASAPRLRSRVLKLRTAANDVGEALETFDGGDGSPEDQARWNGMVERFQNLQRGAELAEKTEAEKPHKARIEQLAKLQREKQVRKVGTRLQKDQDASEVRRLVQCACSASALFRGLELMWRDGWGSKWLAPTRATDHSAPLVRVWFCPDCWVPPRLGPIVRTFTLPPTVLVLARRRADYGKRVELQAALSRLVVVDPEMGKAWLTTIVLEAGTGKRAEAWRTLLDTIEKGVSP